jgi:hypothetical protein
VLQYQAYMFSKGYSIWDLDQLSGPGPSGHCRLAMAHMAPAAAVLAGVGAPPGPGAVAVSAPASGQAGFAHLTP